MTPLPGERWSQAGPEASALAQEEEPSIEQARARPRPRSTSWTPDSEVRTPLLTPHRRGAHRAALAASHSPSDLPGPPFTWSSPTSSVHPQGRAQAWTPAPSCTSPCPSRSAPGPWSVYLCRQVPSLREPGLGSKKQVGPFDAIKLVTGASEKQEKQTWAPGETLSSFFPLPFTLINGQFSQPLPRCASRGLTVLFIVLSTSAGSPQLAGQWRPLPRGADISRDLSGSCGLSSPRRARRRGPGGLAGFPRWAMPAGLSMPNRPGHTSPSCSTAQTTQGTARVPRPPPPPRANWCGPVLLWKAHYYDTF